MDTDPEELGPDDLSDLDLGPLGDGTEDPFSELDLPEMGLDSSGVGTPEELAEPQPVPEPLGEPEEGPLAEALAEEVPEKAEEKRPLFGAGGRFESLDVFTTALGIAALAILIASACLLLELGRYDFQFGPK